MGEYGQIVKKQDIIPYFKYHGNKMELKEWVEANGNVFAGYFENIPFGGLKLKGELLVTCYILKSGETEPHYSTMSELEFNSGKYFNIKT